MKRIALVKFSDAGQVYAFSSDEPRLEKGDAVLAETGQGPGLARVVAVRDVEPDAVPEDMSALLRLATAEDLETDAENARLVERAREFCQARIRERGLEMKLVNVESLFDRSKLIFYFTAPTRIDFRELVKELVREYHTRIELRQIGVRHETQMLGAVGSCGMVCCCRRFLHRFVPVTIKMAKEQNLFLNPTKISGICGRLLCCLSYEQENYDLFHRSCPRLGKRYQTSEGLMKVLRANLFRNSVTVLTEQGEERELTIDEWNALHPCRPESAQSGNTPSGTQPPAQAPKTAGAFSEMVVVVAEPAMLEQGVLDDALNDAFDAFAEEPGLLSEQPQSPGRATGTASNKETAGPSALAKEPAGEHTPRQKASDGRKHTREAAQGDGFDMPHEGGACRPPKTMPGPGGAPSGEAAPRRRGHRRKRRK
ncbi:MAG TPA: hypothetical protein IAB01_06735 [Candidatus Avidesulfovibrio excrementigallinarum]|nr:hypothetical protein [Candidatus Avidesulfovibrio excrementigallinarum]